MLSSQDTAVQYTVEFENNKNKQISVISQSKIIKTIPTILKFFITVIINV